MPLSPINPQELAKQAAAKAAINYIKPGMKIGLGTGSTATFFIQLLGEKVAHGLDIAVLPSSKKSEELARSYSIPLLDPLTTIQLDLTVDGADEVDSQKRMIKGGGGALLREKIVANISKEMVVIVDESKLVTSFNKFPLPVEITSFAKDGIIHCINLNGLKGTLRLKADKTPYLTDNNNFIYDIDLKNIEADWNEVNLNLLQIPGVVETGFFIDYANKIIIGKNDGSIEIR